MDVDGALAVARLILELGNVDGRKRLQKLVHLLGAGSHADFKQRFILHYYGPFSRQLVAQVDFLSAAEFVEETREESGGYSYRVAGDEAKEQISTLHGTATESPPWADLARQLNDKSTEVLEAVSTLVYLHSHGVGAETLQETFAQTKPHLTRHFSDARRFAEELSLIH